MGTTTTYAMYPRTSLRTVLERPIHIGYSQRPFTWPAGHVEAYARYALQKLTARPELAAMDLTVWYNKESERDEVLDGQHRVLTLIMLCAAAAARLPPDPAPAPSEGGAGGAEADADGDGDGDVDGGDNSGSSPAEVRQAYVQMVTRRGGARATSAFPQNDAFLRGLLVEGSPPPLPQPPASPLHDAYGAVQRALRDCVPPEEAASHMPGLLLKLMDCTLFDVRRISLLGDAEEFFINANTKGVPLAPFNAAKAVLLQAVPDDDARQLFERFCAFQEAAERLQSAAGLRFNRTCLGSRLLGLASRLLHPGGGTAMKERATSSASIQRLLESCRTARDRKRAVHACLETAERALGWLRDLTGTHVGMACARLHAFEFVADVLLVFALKTGRRPDELARMVAALGALHGGKMTGSQDLSHAAPELTEVLRLARELWQGGLAEAEFLHAAREHLGGRARPLVGAPGALRLLGGCELSQSDAAGVLHFIEAEALAEAEAEGEAEEPRPDAALVRGGRAVPVALGKRRTGAIGCFELRSSQSPTPGKRRRVNTQHRFGTTSAGGGGPGAAAGRTAQLAKAVAVAASKILEL